MAARSLFHHVLFLCFQLEENVIAKGNVEVWIGELQMQQQKSLHGIIRDASNIISDPAFEVLGFIGDYPAQVYIVQVYNTT